MATPTDLCTATLTLRAGAIRISVHQPVVHRPTGTPVLQDQFYPVTSWRDLERLVGRIAALKLSRDHEMTIRVALQRLGYDSTDHVAG
jgi:hypothetical protein